MPAGIYVGTDDGLYVLGAERRLHLPGRRLRTLAADDAAIWALVGESEIFSAGAAGIWRHVTRLRNVRMTCVHPAPSGVLIGTHGADLYLLRDRRVEQVEGFSYVEARDKWHTPWGEPPSVRSIGVDGDGTLFVNVHVGGIPRSTDDGLSWEPTLDIDEDAHQVLALPGDGPVLAATARGLATSWDRGTSWNHRALGLNGSYCRAVAVCDDTVLLSASQGPDGRGAAVYRGGVEGVRFERCGKGLPDELPGNVDTHCLSGSGATAAFGTQAGTVYATHDAGRTWELVADELPAIRCVLVR